MVYNLISLCGLAQSPILWYGAINAGILTVGFTPMQSDPCFDTPDNDNIFVILTLYCRRHLDTRNRRERGEAPEKAPHGSLRNGGQW